MFVTGCDADGRGHILIGRMRGDVAPLDPADEWRVLLGPGDTGSFDESGVVATDARRHPNGFEILFHGYRLRKGGGWWNAIGRAVVRHDGSILDRTVAPLVGLTEEHPLSVGYASWDDASPRVLFNSAVGMDPETHLPRRYEIRVREADGSSSTIDVAAEGFATTRPCLRHIDGRTHLWFAQRGARYVIREVEILPGGGIAQIGSFPPDGRAGETSETTYPFVVVEPQATILLYNGDGYGRTGFGVAIRTPR